jgi:L-alanine-DL-glutamate epimerase-like enolase superfamily enzyme
MFVIKYCIKELRFEYPFTISKGTKTHQPTFIVELSWRGICGYGEAPMIDYYGVTADRMVKDIEAKRKFVENFSFTEPKRFWHFLHHLFPDNPFLVSALDMAGWDLYGKIRNKPLYQIWGFDLTKSPKTDYTIGIGSLDHMILKIREHPAPIYKIKVGTNEDLEILCSIREHTDSILRIDANAGWTYEQALSYIPTLEKLEVELIEQPLEKENIQGHKSLSEKTKIPIIADESCVSQKDVLICANAFDGINIKLTKASGITPVLEMIKNARKENLKIMLGCMNESSIGTAAIAHLSPEVDYIDADGPLLLTEDLASGIKYKDYTLIPSQEPGLGIKVNDDLFSVKD